MKIFISTDADKLVMMILERANTSDVFTITNIEVDKDNVHMIIDWHPSEPISNIVRQLKAYSTYHIWQNHAEELQRQFWKEKMFWSKSYFVCSVGDCSRETIEEYVKNQGGKQRYKREIHHNS